MGELTGPQAELLQGLGKILADPRRRVYAVMDGALFDDLPLDLTNSGIAHRSLYKNVQDIELVRAGPWLVDPYHGLDRSLNLWGGLPTEQTGVSPIADDTNAAMNAHALDTGPASFHASGGRVDPAVQLERIVAMNGELPAAVFWIGDAALTEAALWRHLRTINMILLPKEADPNILTIPADDEDTHEAFMFRHADGNVLAEVLPVLDAAQFSRVFGPARELVFLAPHHPSQSTGSILRRARLPDNSPAATSGLLKLSQTQVDEIEDARNLVTRWDTVAYLRECAAEETQGLSDKELYATVGKIEERGFSLGFESMTAHMIFAFLCITGAGDVVDSDEFREDVTESGMHPDDALNEVYSGMMSAAESDARSAV
jgi:Domain of unknown function (DUF4123)